MKPYVTPELHVHGGIAMLTMEVEVDNPQACSKDPKEFPGDAKPEVPEFDVFCGFSHS